MPGIELIIIKILFQPEQITFDLDESEEFEGLTVQSEELR